MSNFYNGTKLLSLNDLNNRKPEIYICTSNRSAGKTTFFNRMVVNGFFKRQNKFCLIYRYKYELDNIADKFFKDIGGLFFPNYMMRTESRSKGVYHELFLQPINETQKVGKCCGYAVALNSADTIKKLSHLLSDTHVMLFDEFQSETNAYCHNEIAKFISLHTSIARGGGQQARRVPVIMISNPVTLLNPYYAALGISTRLTQNTRFLRGNGFVLEQGFNESAATQQKESAFNQAFASHSYIGYASQGIYLNDSASFIEKPTGNRRYLATLKYNNSYYSISEYAEAGIIYCTDKADMSYPYKLVITTNDHDINYVMLNKNNLFLSNMRYYFDRGCFRFKNLACKEVILKALSY